MSDAGAAGTGGDARSRPEHLVVGHVSKAHGTKGELFVWPLTDRPDQVFAPGREIVLGTTDGQLETPVRRWVVEAVRPFKRGFLLRLEGVSDRNTAEPLGGRYLLASTETLAPLEEGELYYHELLGLEVVTADGDVVGRIREVFETEPAPLLEVKDAETVRLIPFTASIVRHIDVKAGRLVIDPPAGLLDI